MRIWYLFLLLPSAAFGGAFDRCEIARAADLAIAMEAGNSGHKVHGVWVGMEGVGFRASAFWKPSELLLQESQYYCEVSSSSLSCVLGDSGPASGVPDAEAQIGSEQQRMLLRRTIELFAKEFRPPSLIFRISAGVEKRDYVARFDFADTEEPVQHAVYRCTFTGADWDCSSRPGK